MSKPPFDQWAPAEVARLRATADALERALELYAGNGRDNFTYPTAQKGRRGPRVSKYEPMFQAFEKEARPLSLDDMYEIAMRLNVQIDRNNLRSQVFAQRHLGRARSEGQGYLWGLSKQEAAAAADQEDAA
jgi:hypothetical protein